MHTPRAIRGWWGASTAIVVARKNGYYIAAWGDEDDPTYLSYSKIAEFDAPHRIVLVDFEYYAKDGYYPVDAEFVVTFEVLPHEKGSELRVIHDGFPPGSEDFFEACVRGWQDTCAGIQRYMAETRNS